MMPPPAQQEPSNYTAAYLNQLLEQKCPEEYAAVLTIDPTLFYLMPSRPADGGKFLKDRDINRMSLLIGTSDGELTSGMPVYICIGGEGNSKLALCCDGALEAWNLTNLAHVILQPPFVKLCRDQAKNREILHDSEKHRLKAYVYYLFLQAGYLEEIQQYPSFEDHLRLACVSLAQLNGSRGKSVRQKSAKKQETVKAKVAARELLRPVDSVRECAMQGNGGFIDVAVPGEKIQAPTAASSGKKRCMEGNFEDDIPARRPRQAREYATRMPTPISPGKKRCIENDDEDDFPARKSRQADYPAAANEKATSKNAESGDAVSHPLYSIILARANESQLTQMRLHHARAEDAMLALQNQLDLQLTQAAAYDSRITQQESDLSHLREHLYAASDENAMLRNQLDKFQQQNENGATGLADLRAELEMEKAAKEQAVMGKSDAERKVSEMEKAQTDAMAALRRAGRIGC